MITSSAPSSAPIALLDLPHAEARRLAATAPVYLPINPVEYHGPHLSLHNDSVCSHGLIRDLHQRLTPDAPLLLARDLEIGVEPCPGPGTRDTPYREVKRQVREACEGLIQLGAKQVVLMTFHGSPLHAAAIEHGVRTLKRAGVAAAAPFNLVMDLMLTADGRDYPEPVEHLDPAVRDALLEGLPLDFHAGFFETSVALHYAPETVGPRHALPPCPPVKPAALVRALARLARAVGAKRTANELDFAATAVGWFALRPFPGYTSRPDLADSIAGACFARMVVDRMEGPVREALAGTGQTPEPIMSWMRWLTLGGRIPGPSVPLDAILRLPTE